VHWVYFLETVESEDSSTNEAPVKAEDNNEETESVAPKSTKRKHSTGGGGTKERAKKSPRKKPEDVPPVSAFDVADMVQEMSPLVTNSLHLTGELLELPGVSEF